jgi:hypothetical protein
VSDQPEALLALADRIEEAAGNPIAIDPQAATELRHQHGEIEALKAERNRAHRACEQISVRLHAAAAERDALKAQRQPLTQREAFEWMDRAPRGLFYGTDMGVAQAIWLTAKDFTERAHGIGGDK